MVSHLSPNELGEQLEPSLERARLGDAAGMEALYRAYAPGLLSYLRTQVRRPEDAEDVVGQAFLEAVRDLARFRGDAAGFRAWLFRIGHNRAVDLARRQDRRPEVTLDELEDRPGDDEAEGAAVRNVESQRLWAAVHSLPADQRRAIALRLAAGLSATEIARVLGKRRGAVKALQHRALQNLARELGAAEHDRVQTYPEAGEERFSQQES